VEDDARGIPTGSIRRSKKSALEMVMPFCMPGGNSIRTRIRYPRASRVGVSCVNALSSDLHVTVFREGKIFEQDIRRVAAVPGKEIGVSEKTGTTVRFWPDASIFITLTTTKDILEGRLRELFVPQRDVRISCRSAGGRRRGWGQAIYSKTFYS